MCDKVLRPVTFLLSSEARLFACSGRKSVFMLILTLVPTPMFRPAATCLIPRVSYQIYQFCQFLVSFDTLSSHVSGSFVHFCAFRTFTLIYAFMYGSATAVR